MLAAQPIEHLARRLGAAGLHIRQALLNAFDGFDSIEQRLVGRRILDHELGLAVDGQDKGVSSLPEALEQVHRIAFELTERTNVVSKIEHHILIEFALNLMITRSCRRDQLPQQLSPEIVPANAQNRTSGANRSQVARSRNVLNRRLQPLGHLTVRGFPKDFAFALPKRVGHVGFFGKSRWYSRL
jgi:hypothetical protein